LTSIVLNSATVAVGTLVLSSSIEVETYVDNRAKLGKIKRDLDNFFSFVVLWFLITNGVMYLKYKWFGVFVNVLVEILFIKWFYGNFRNTLVDVEKKIEGKASGSIFDILSTF